MEKVYLYNNYHNGDLITNRCLIQPLLGRDLELAVGSYKNRHYLVEDLPVTHIVSQEDENFPQSSCLSGLTPHGFRPVNTWCGTFKDLDHRPPPLGYHNWNNIVDTWNRQNSIQLHASVVPMVDFPKINVDVLEKSIYVENGHTRSGHCHFNFDLQKLGETFPDLNFYCTAEHNCHLPNVHYVKMNLIELSSVSDKCIAIVGKGSGPFMCTLTETNRHKPKAVVQFNSPEFWCYEGNPLKYLKTETELLDFLHSVASSNVVN